MRFPSLAASAAALLCVSSAPATVALTTISAAPDPVCLATGLSADGATVIGRVHTASGFEHPFAWSAPLGLHYLDQPSSLARPAAASANGSVVVGTSFISGFPAQQAVRWSMGTTQRLAPLDGDDAAEALACSADGSIVVGRSMGPSGQQAVRWNAAGVAERINPDHPGSGLFTAVGISADAQIIAGNTGLSGDAIYRVTPSNPFETIPNNDILGLVARGLSSDGSCIFGSALFPSSPQTAMRWTPATGYQSLGPLTSSAYAASADGALIGGEGNGHAFIWSDSLGAATLSTFLAAQGLDVSHWDFQNITGISADGSALTGYGFLDNTYTSFIVTGIPAPGASSLLLPAPLLLLRRTRRPR